MNETFTSIFGNSFTIDEEVIHRRYCSIRENGYLIVPDGRLIVIPPGIHHGSVFLEFLSKYLEQDISNIREKYQIVADNGIMCLPILEEYGLIPYFGIGLNPDVPKYMELICENSEMYQVDGTLYIPRNFDEISTEQIRTCQELLKTNLYYNGKEKNKISIGNGKVHHCNYNSLEFLNILEQLLKERKQFVK